MPRLRALSGEELIRIFTRFGFDPVSQRGSHVKLRRTLPNGTRQILTVVLHDEVDKGTLRAIYRQALRFNVDVNPTLHELIAQQGKGQVTGVRVLRGDFWPQDREKWFTPDNDLRAPHRSLPPQSSRLSPSADILAKQRRSWRTGRTILGSTSTRTRPSPN